MFTTYHLLHLGKGEKKNTDQVGKSRYNQESARK